MPIRTFCLIAMAFAAMAAQAGALLKTRIHDIAANKDSASLVYAQDGNMRAGSDDPQRSYVVFGNDAMYSINPKDKTYTTLDRASIGKMADTLNPALKQMQERMAKMSPEQRAQMEKLMGKKIPGAGKPSVQEVRKTARTGKAAGYSCTYTEVLEDGVLSGEYCVVPIGSLKGGKELAESSAKVAAMMADMLKQIDAPWLKQLADKQVENYGKLGGIPVLSRTFSEGKPVRESTLESATTPALPAALFQVPADYTKRELMQPRKK